MTADELTIEERELVEMYRRMPTQPMQKHFVFVARHLFRDALAGQVTRWWLFRTNYFEFLGPPDRPGNGHNGNRSGEVQ